MSERSVIDSNILCRHALQDHDDHSPRSNRLFLRIARGEEHVFCPTTAVFEAIHILHGRYQSPRSEVVGYLKIVLNYPGFSIDHPSAVIAALDFWTSQPRLDFADCYHLALTADLGMKQIYTFDKKMDRFPGVERIEPGAE